MSKTIRLLIFSLTRWAFFVCSLSVLLCAGFGIFFKTLMQLAVSYCAIVQLMFDLFSVVSPFNAVLMKHFIGLLFHFA